MATERLRLLLILTPLALLQPQPSAASSTLHLALCGGGTIDIPVPGRQDDNNPCPTACHAALCERSRATGGKLRLPH